MWFGSERIDKIIKVPRKDVTPIVYADEVVTVV